MTLLFALFVVLYSIAQVELEKLKQLSHSMQEAFGVKEDSKAPISQTTPSSEGPEIQETIFSHIRGNTQRDEILTRNTRERAAIIAADAKQLERELAQRGLFTSLVIQTAYASP
jgi:flagellar motor protein MotB